MAIIVTPVPAPAEAFDLLDISLVSGLSGDSRVFSFDTTETSTPLTAPLSYGYLVLYYGYTGTSATQAVLTITDSGASDTLITLDSSDDAVVAGYVLPGNWEEVPALSIILPLTSDVASVTWGPGGTLTKAVGLGLWLTDSGGSFWTNFKGQSET